MKTRRLKTPLAAMFLLACHGGAASTPDGGGGTGSDGGGGTPASGWSHETLINHPPSFIDYDLSASAVGINASGIAVALWREQPMPSGMNLLWANVYRAGVWGAPLAIADPGSSEGAVSVLPNGDAMVVYVQPPSIQVKRYLLATGTWTAATQLSVDPAASSSPRIAADRLGNAIAIWIQGDQIWARRYDASAGWAATVTQLSASPRLVYVPEITVDGDNRFTAVWVEDSAPFDPSGGTDQATPHARRYVTDWEVDQRVGWAPTDLLGDFDSAGRIAVDAGRAGSVFVVWEQFHTQPDQSLQQTIDAARFDPIAGAWSKPETIATHSSNLSWPQVAVDGSGRALTSWSRQDASDPHIVSLQGSRFDAASGTWGTPELLDQTGTNEIQEAVLAIDDAGNGDAVWFEPNKGVIDRRFGATTGAWGTWNVIGHGVDNLRLAMSENGHAVVIGDRLDLSAGTREVWAWVYTP